jgi:hypothetical protein
MGRLSLLLGVTVGLSIVHYTDNWRSFEKYPRTDGPIELTADVIWISWIVFTVGALAGWLLYRRGDRLKASFALAFYSLSGLVSIGHYAAPGMSELAWWRHVFIWADIVLGALVLAFALRTAAEARRASFSDRGSAFTRASSRRAADSSGSSNTAASSTGSRDRV